MKKYSIKIIIAISRQELENRIKEIYNIKSNKRLLDRKINYFRTVKFLLKNKLNRDVTDEEVFQEMIRMRDTPLYKPKPNINLRKKLQDIYGELSEEEFQKKENLFYQYKTKFKKENPEITDEEIFHYLIKSYNKEIQKGPPRNLLLEEEIENIYGTLSPEQFQTKRNLFYQYKRKLRKENPEITDQQILEYMRQIQEKRKKRKNTIEQDLQNIIKEASHIQNIQQIIKTTQDVQNIIKTAQELDCKQLYKYSDQLLDKLNQIRYN